MPTACNLAAQIEERLLRRNSILEDFFTREARPLALACRDMAERFLSGGRLLALGCGPYSTDAQHVSVEFVHPVIVGKRALPALDLSALGRPWLEAILRSDDIVFGFGPPEGDAEVWAALASASARGAMTFALPGPFGSYALQTDIKDPFIHQELVEIFYHTLWETVHVFLEHRELGQDVGDAGFLYPFLGQQKQKTSSLVDEVASSIQMKVRDDTALRTRLAKEESEGIGAAAIAIHERLLLGGKLILFGNGGSATDANDWAMDCVLPQPGRHAIPAISLSMEPANLTALANDIGVEVIFLRQLMAQAQPHDVAIGISTSGGSRNIVSALEEARKRKLLTIALLGNDGGEIARRSLADFPIIIRSDYIPRIQEVQASAYHVILDTLEALHHARA
ncbi:SIS domain-containing protein [Acidicapsa acidisoli]|uniref:SIS domain-containing protein n=1 Tax=Acidicapsa acidisoli TaxID=1615681 RepID=UPI0021DFE156|nr:SIS domain-containing protein [Acidicapsa acidisoli]